MRTKSLKQRMGLGVIALSILAAPGMNAQCRARNSGTSAPEFRNLQEPAELDEEGSSDQARSTEAFGQEKHDSDVTVLGLWKKIYYDREEP
jgi:hypothetical protein